MIFVVVLIGGQKVIVVITLRLSPAKVTNRETGMPIPGLPTGDEVARDQTLSS